MNVLIELDEATPLLKKVRGGIKDRTKVNRVIANAALPVYQRNFLSLAQTNRNPYGARSTFWPRMLAGTTAEADESSASIRMPREVALRFFGGTVVPKVAKLLAIPARSEAYGKSPRDFSDLRFAILGGVCALVQADQQAIRYRRVKGQTRVQQGPTRGGLVFFWLVPSATINPNPAVLPDQEVVVKAVFDGVDGYFVMLTNRRARR